ncbi:hypothetical protein DFH28DRAFT_934822 [Melampsora americana]|nr:hypothetical protein DFH28DRAFT_934822 [Melampsora americana]
MWTMYCTRGLPMDGFDAFNFQMLGNQKDHIQTVENDFNPNTKALPVFQHTYSNHPDRTLDMMIPHDLSHENKEMIHTTSRITPLEDYGGSATSAFYETGAVQTPTDNSIFLNYHSHNDSPSVPLEDSFSTYINPIYTNANLDNVVNTDFPNTEWIDHWSQNLEHSKSHLELSNIHASTSKYGQDVLKRKSISLESAEFQNSATQYSKFPLQSPYLVDNLMDDMVDLRNMYVHPTRNSQDFSISYPSIPCFLSSHSSEVSDQDALIGVNPGQKEWSHLTKTGREEYQINLPSLVSQNIDFNHVHEHTKVAENQHLLLSERLSNPLVNDIIQGDDLYAAQAPEMRFAPLVFRNNHYSSLHSALDESVSGRILISPGSDNIWSQDRPRDTNVNKKCKPISEDKAMISSVGIEQQRITSISGLWNEGVHKKSQGSLENGGSHLSTFAQLMMLITHLDISKHSSLLTAPGRLLLPELNQEIEKQPGQEFPWHKINQAQEVINIPFINLLLILHPESSDHEASKAELIQDGLKFLTGIISQWSAEEVKNHLKPWKMLPQSHFDVSDSSYLLQYITEVVGKKMISLTALWKLWKRWFRCSVYPKKNIVVGIREFSSLIKKNLIKMKLKNCNSHLKELLENLDLDTSNPPQLGSLKKPYKWRDYYTLTMHIGKYQYEMLTLRVEADTHFDHLRESLNERSFSQNQGDPISLSRNDRFVRKLYNELTPFFFGSLLALKSRQKNDISIKDLIDDGWKFLKNLFDLIKQSFYTKDPALKGIDPIAHGSMNYILSFYKRHNTTGPFSLRSVFSLLMAWYNQSSLPNKHMVKDSDDLYILIKIMHSNNEFPVLTIK